MVMFTVLSGAPDGDESAAAVYMAQVKVTVGVPVAYA